MHVIGVMGVKMPAPLDGLRVIDAASWLAAPSAAALMSDMGADVIKVEPPNGDSYRSSLATRNITTAVIGGWENDNRGKRGIALDLEQPAGREILLRLCETADVLIINFTAKRAERYGLTFESVIARNPRIIHTSVSGYGTRGPDADRLSFDFLAFWARSGMQSLIGEVGEPPVTMIGGQGDHTTTLTTLAAVLSALRLRDRTGEGQRVEVTLQRTAVWTISSHVQTALLGGPPPEKMNRLAPRNPIASTYQTADGRWLRLQMPQVQQFWPQFCPAVGHPEWAIEFPDFASVTANGAVLRERIESLILQHDLSYWHDLLEASKLLWAPVATLDEVIADPQLREMGAFEQVEHPVAGTIEMVSVPFNIAGADIRVRRAAPEIGEHTAELMAEAGFTPEEMAAYAEQRVFG